MLAGALARNRRGHAGLSQSEEPERWNGTGWTPLTGLTDLSDANGWDNPDYYLNIMAWDPSLLLARGPDGMRVYRFTSQVNRPGSWRMLTNKGPCATSPGTTGFECDSDTIQLARGIRAVPSDQPVVLARDRTTGIGLRLARFNPANDQWSYDTGDGHPWHEKALDAPEYRQTIQAADIDGDGHDEVFGRIAGGMVVFEPRLESGRFTSWGRVRSYLKPALADDPWY